MPIQIVPKILRLMKRRQGRERRMATLRVFSITRQIKEVINVRLTVVWSLWLTLTHRATINGVRGGHLLGQAVRSHS